MFKIREKQFSLLAAARFDAFVADAVAQVDRFWPQVAETMPRASLRASVEQTLREGISMGLDDESSLLQLLNVSLALGGLEDSAALAIRQNGHSPRQKLDALNALARRELRRRNV
ncbi:hypothetical protein [Pyxidicoccus caerfyrddinensis]|uniref:hypothetical protein n=1 Tax=Pyxidicoccus caerfyrddinensis TaxID=2709663 RepID=UPI0013DB05B6|nr:hypothetical protein [Pyxidicoccus caerfyrddinensis]